MAYILDKEVLSEKDIMQLIELKIEESINLDFKASEALNKNKKDEIRKDVSAFANSEGGIIVYGMAEKDHVADELSFIDGNIITKEWIEHVIQDGIKRKIEGLKIIPIRFNADIKKTVYVVKIPDSLLAPHMTSNKKFYRRYNFESVQMEEYEIRNLYNRKDKIKLKIDGVACSDMGAPYEREEDRIYQLAFQIENIGTTIAKDFKVKAEFNLHEIGFRWKSQQNKLPVASYFEDKKVITLSNDSSIYPGEIYTIGVFDLVIHDFDLHNVKEHGIMNVELLYYNGNDKFQTNLKNLLIL